MINLILKKVFDLCKYIVLLWVLYIIVMMFLGTFGVI